MLEPNIYACASIPVPIGWPIQAVRSGSASASPITRARIRPRSNRQRRRFEHIRVDVSDTLQRHRMIGQGVPPTAGYGVAAPKVIVGLRAQHRFSALAASPTRLSAGMNGCGTPNFRPCMRLTAAWRHRIRS